ncbi:hypothetical protein, partial [Nocardia sp. NPDC004722]
MRSQRHTFISQGAQQLRANESPQHAAPVGRQLGPRSAHGLHPAFTSGFIQRIPPDIHPGYRPYVAPQKSNTGLIIGIIAAVVVLIIV